MLLLEALEQVLSHLQDQGARAAVLGGLAVSVWTEPRFTRDVDLAVAVQDDAVAELLIRRLTERGYRLVATVEQKVAARLATARLLPPGESEEGMIVDLLFASSGIEPEIVDAAVDVDIGGSTPVCSVSASTAWSVLLGRGGSAICASTTRNREGRPRLCGLRGFSAFETSA